jgi:hypothetical protein
MVLVSLLGDDNEEEEACQGVGEIRPRCYGVVGSREGNSTLGGL